MLADVWSSSFHRPYSPLVFGVLTCFFLGNLSWNTNDEILHQVRSFSLYIPLVGCLFLESCLSCIFFPNLSLSFFISPLRTTCCPISLMSGSLVLPLSVSRLWPGLHLVFWSPFSLSWMSGLAWLGFDEYRPSHNSVRSLTFVFSSLLPCFDQVTY